MKKHLQSQIGLGWEIEIELGSPGMGVISSNLSDTLRDEQGDLSEEFSGAIHAIESMVLAMYCAGVDGWHDRIVYSIDTTVEAILNNFD